MDNYEIIGHKGAGEKGRPEAGMPNSAKAFAWAFANGADRVECDLAISGDGVVFIHHDPMIAGPNGKMTLVSTLTLEEIETANGPRLTFAKLLEQFPEGNFILELKRHTDYRRIFNICRLKYIDGEFNRFRFLSFEFDALAFIKKTEPRFACAYIATCVRGRFEPFVSNKHIEMCVQAGVEEISGHILSFRPRRIDQAKAAGLAPSVGFVNDANALEHCRKHGIHRLYTDTVPELRGWIDALGDK